ncbi:questin oxidase family protein [Streptomyces capparidis]
MERTGILDEALERLHATGPEFRGWLSNHAPMAVESMVRHGFGPRVHSWVDAYTDRLEELPRARVPVDAREWRQALGDPGRLPEWLELFRVETAERPWREVLRTWWPRLLPGIAAGATHGVIRTGHAVRVLLRDGESGPRVAELGQALGYWAARWQAVPGAAAPGGTAEPDLALDGVPPVPDQSGGILHRLPQLEGLPGWPEALGGLRPAATPGQARELLAGVADAATVRYLRFGHGEEVMLVHAATAPTAVLRTLPALPEEMWEPSLRAAWAACAAVTAAYTPAEAVSAAEERRLTAAAGDPGELVARAVRHGDAHAIKLADTAVEVFERRGDVRALAAGLRGVELIVPEE